MNTAGMLRETPKSLCSKELNSPRHQSEKKSWVWWQGLVKMHSPNEVNITKKNSEEISSSLPNYEFIGPKSVKF